MIDFACKKFDLDEVVKCSLALTKSDFRLLRYLMKHDRKFTTEELAASLGLDKSTIQRGVKRLHEKGLVRRSQINQSVGGYIFLYQIKDKENIRRIILDIVEGWTQTVRESIKKW